VDTFTCGSTAGSCVPAPISLGASTDIVVVELFGTGIRHLSSEAAVSAAINGQALPVQYAGAQPSDLGLDQVNLEIPHSLVGSGQVNLVVTVAITGGTVTLNTVTLDIQ